MFKIDFWKELLKYTVIKFNFSSVEYMKCESQMKNENECIHVFPINMTVGVIHLS